MIQRFESDEGDTDSVVDVIADLGRELGPISDAIAEKNLGDMPACVEILGRTTYYSLLRESSKPVHFLEDLV